MYAQLSKPTEYRAALYIRLSKEDDNDKESESIANQRSILREFSKKNNFAVYGEYTDDGYSGGNYDRPAFKRMIEDIEAKKLNMVITKDMSRLGRDYIQTGYYMEKYFPEKQVRYISILDGVDTGIDSSINDITPFKAIFNDLYAKDISKKIKAVKHDKQRRGLFIGPKAAYGYKISQEHKNTLVIDEEAAEVVRLMFKMAVSGKSCREIAIILSERGIPTPAVYANLSVPKKGPYSGLWSSEGVTNILRNQMYIGNMVQGRTKKVNYKSKKSIKIPKDQWIIVENTHTAIIEKADFEKVQLLIDSRKHTRSRTHDYLLKGLIFCKECGYPLSVINRKLSKNRVALYFVCRTYQRYTKSGVCTCHCIRVETVTNAVLDSIKELCRKYIDRQEFSGILETVIEESNNKSTKETDVQELSVRIANITENMDKLYSDKLSGALDDVDFQRFYTKLRKERALLQERLIYLESLKAADSQTIYNIDELIERFTQSADTNRELLCALIKKIEMTADKHIHIHFRFRKLEYLQ